MVEYLQTLSKALESIGIVAAWSMWVSLLFGILNTALIVVVLVKFRKLSATPVAVQNNTPSEEREKENHTGTIALLILVVAGIIGMAVFLASQI